MAFNLQTFKTRTLTAIVFVVVMLAGLLLNHWTFFILFSFIHFGCWREYQRLVGEIDSDYKSITPFHRYGVMIAGWCIMLYFTNDQYILFGIRLHALGWWLGLIFVFILPLMELLFTRNIQLKLIAHSIFGLFYISLSLGLLVDLKHIPFRNPVLYKESVLNANLLPLFIIGCMWINDTMAYIVGSLIGKTPFSKISPKKTWEGTIGGIILATLLMGYLGWLLDDYHILNAGLLTWIFCAFVAVVAGTFGDLLESKLKRLAGVKDSGHIMPGHGGFLDRFDSLLVATPFVWLYVKILMS